MFFLGTCGGVILFYLLTVMIFPGNFDKNIDISFKSLIISWSVNSISINFPKIWKKSDLSAFDFFAKFRFCGKTAQNQIRQAQIAWKGFKKCLKGLKQHQKGAKGIKNIR